MDILNDRDGWYQEYQQNWLKHFYDTGETLWKIYNPPHNSSQITGKGVDLSKSKLLLISSAGGYLKDSQETFDASNLLGDYTTRIFPSDTPLDTIAFAHEHYDHTAVNADPQVLLPLRHLETLVAEGIIGEVASNVVSFMGYQPDVTRLLDETIPAIREIVVEENPQAVLLVPS